jgi:hypothetical protein
MDPSGRVYLSPSGWSGRDDPRMTSEFTPPEALLAATAPAIRALADALRAVVRDSLPGVLERVRPGWGVIGYDVPAGRRTRFFCWIWAQPEHVHLGFVHGALMADPGRVLAGAGVTKLARWLTFEPGDEVEPVRLAPLIRDSARVASLSRAERLLALEMARERIG